MIIREFTEADYPTYTTWLALHNWPLIPRDMLPRTGVIVEVDGINTCAGFLYNTDSNIAWLEYVVANPLCDKLIRDKALDSLIPALLERAKGMGKSAVFSSIEHPGLIKRYQKHGGIIADSGVTNFIWRI